MNLLASILPGIRDLRAPVAAGYIWLLNLWLLFGDQIQDRERATGILASLYELEGLLSEIGFLVILSFVAYLIGAVSDALSAAVLQRIRIGSSRGSIASRYRRWSRLRGHTREPRRLGPLQLRLALHRAHFVDSLKSGSWSYADYLRTRVAVSLEEIRAQDPAVLENASSASDIGAPDSPLSSLGSLIVYEEIESAMRRVRRDSLPSADLEASESDGPPFETDQERYERNNRRRSFDALSDLDLVRPRLMSEQSTLYGEYDRLQSEAEFRAAIALPLTLFFLILAAQESWFWLAALLGLSVLVVDAMRRQNRADLTLMAAVSSGMVKSPLLENLERALEVAKKQRGDGGPEKTGGRPGAEAASTGQKRSEATTA